MLRLVIFAAVFAAGKPRNTWTTDLFRQLHGGRAKMRKAKNFYITHTLTYAHARIGTRGQMREDAEHVK